MLHTAGEHVHEEWRLKSGWIFSVSRTALRLRSNWMHWMMI